MQRLSGPLLGIDQGQKTVFAHYETDGEMWTGHGPREIRAKVRFSASFMRPPVVHAHMGLIDMATEPYIRADLTTDAITKHGFVLVFRTWDDSRVARIRADWMAIGELPDDERWDV
ncbi:MAG: H-type lectin domain-containing protein [Rhodobacteraceae bacterium]|nr:H-type lectin domain-containing protein [Paracoccaceae bacterium]